MAWTSLELWRRVPCGGSRTGYFQSFRANPKSELPARKNHFRVHCSRHTIPRANVCPLFTWQAVMNKDNLRIHMKAARAALAADAAAHNRLSLAAQQALLAAPLWRDADLICAYAPVRGEVDTALLWQRAWAQGKLLLLPRCLAEAGQMEMVLCAGPQDLVPGAWNIPEPRLEIPPYGGPWPDNGLILTPGLAFDKERFRLGYGGGYYDRFFAARPELVRVGLAFALQCVPVLPREPWDLPLHHICTEEGLC